MLNPHCLLCLVYFIISINTIYLLGGTIKKIDVCYGTLLHYDLYDQVKSPSPSPSPSATLLCPLSLSPSSSWPQTISLSPSRSIWSPVWGLETWHRRPTTKRFSQFSWWSLQVTNRCSRIICKIDNQYKVKHWLRERQIQLLTRIKRTSTMYPIHANPTKANQSDLWRASLDYLSRTPFQERLKNTTRDIKLFFQPYCTRPYLDMWPRSSSKWRAPPPNTTTCSTAFASLWSFTRSRWWS